MADTEPTPGIQSEAREIAEQAIVELEILLGIEQSLRIALQWMVRGRGNSHKLSTLRFHTWSSRRLFAFDYRAEPTPGEECCGTEE